MCIRDRLGTILYLYFGFNGSFLVKSYVNSCAQDYIEETYQNEQLNIDEMCIRDSFLTIGTVILIAIELGKQLKHKEVIVPVVALSAYVTLCNSSTNIEVEGVKELVNVANVLPKEFTSAQGLFLGMITAIIATEIYCRMADSGFLRIKMPETVPTNVSQSFNVLFPGVLTILAISGFGLLFKTIFGLTLYDAISTCIQAPLRGVLTGLPGYLLIFGLSCVFWVIGIHGCLLYTSRCV